MLYLSRQPRQAQIVEDRKAIILMDNKIIFTHIDAIQDSISIPLIGSNPKSFTHSPAALETLVVTTTTLQIVYCDWKTQVRLVKVLILQNPSIQTIYYEPATGWNVLGLGREYEPAKINFHSPATKPGRKKTLCESAVGRNKYLLNEDQLLKSEAGSQYQQVRWKDRMMVMKNTNFNLAMSCTSCLDFKRDVLCFNKNYVLVVSKYEVLYMVIQPNICLSINNLIVSANEHAASVFKIQDKMARNLGITCDETGLLGGCLFDQQLALLNYEANQLRANFVALKKNDASARPVLTSSYQIKQPKMTVNLAHTHSLEDLSKDSSNQLVVSDNDKRRSEPASRPLIRDIVVVEDQINPDQFDEDDSEVLSRSAIDKVQNEERKVIFSNDDDSFSKPLNNESPDNKKYRSMINFDANSESSFSGNGRIPVSNRESKEENGSRDQLMSSVNQTNRSFSGLNKSLNKGKDKSLIKDNSDISIHQDSFEECAATPGFGNDFGGGFSGFENQWNVVEVDKISENQDEIEEEVEESFEESVELLEGDNKILKNLPGLLTKKAEIFLSGKNNITQEEVDRVQNTSYCRLIQDELAVNPMRFDDLVQEFLLQILDEPEAVLFFANNIRTPSPELTKDKLRRLLYNCLNKDSYKPRLTKALQQFKLIEVPEEALIFSRDFVKVINWLDKNAYISDLLAPSEFTIEKLLEEYFQIESFPSEILLIEEEQIEISHPRNMLNVLLYLNEQLNLSIEVVIRVFCTKMLEKQNLDVIDRLLNENVFQICGVERSVLDDSIVTRVNELLDQSVENVGYLWTVIPYLSRSLFDEYNIRLAVISELNKNNISFNFQLMKGIQSLDYLYMFLKNVIQDNSAYNLINLKFDSFYRSLYWIQEGEKPMFLTNEYIRLMQLLSEKFISNSFIKAGFQCLEQIREKIPISFVGKLILLHLEGKLLNRLSGIHYLDKSLQKLFPEYFSGDDVVLPKIQRDHLTMPKFSQSFSCSYEKFSTLYDEFLSGPIELKYLSFYDVNLAFQIFERLEGSQRTKFNKFLAAIDSYLLVDLEEQEENADPRGLTEIKFDDNLRDDVEQVAGSSQLIREEYLLDSGNHKEKKVYKSMTLLNESEGSQRVQRANSDKKSSKNSESNEQLRRLNLLVNKKQKIECLRQIYEFQPPECFYRALLSRHQENLGLHHIEAFKQIYSKRLEFNVPNVIPFSVFLIQDEAAAFEQVKPCIAIHLTNQNFWVIYMICEMMFQKGEIVARILLNKMVQYYADDEQHELVGIVMRFLGDSLTSEFVEELKAQSIENNLSKTTQQIEKFAAPK